MKRGLILCASLATGVWASALSVTVVVQNETCTYANGTAYAAVSGGVPPYTYLWGGGETTDGIGGLSAGTYSVIVTDFVGTQATDDGTVISENYGTIDYNDFGLPHAYCPGQEYREFFLPPQPWGITEELAPWSVAQGVMGMVQPPAAPGNYYVTLGAVAPGSSHSVQFWDTNGCSGTFNFIAGSPIMSWPTFVVVDTQGSCANVPSGMVTFTSSTLNGSETFYALRAEASGDDMAFLNYFQPVGPDQYAFYNLAPGNYWLKHRLGFTYSLLQGGSCASDSVLVTVPDLGPTCGAISGSTYMDYNSDCIDTEANASNVVVEILPGPIYIASGGNFSVVVPNGNYTLTTSAPAIAQSCPASATVNGNSSVANIGHQPTLPLDVAVSLNSGPARPGFELHYYLHVENLSSSSSGATTTTLSFDPTVSFIGALPTPSNVTGNTITWNQSALSIFQDRDYYIRLQVPPDVGLIGTDLLASASVSTANADGDLSNNTVSAEITVTGSYDPNDKTAYTSTRASESLYFIDEDDWVDYVIRFQNTGTDTAFNVVVTDTLPATLDPATVSLVGASHTHTWMMQGQGILKFIFPNILLPDSNVNEPLSHGLISFRIRPRMPIAPGTVIENIANIYFDFNEPVITEPSVLVAEFSTGVGERAGIPMLHLIPNPTNGTLWVRLNGEISGSGLLRIMAYDGRLLMEQRANGPITELDLAALVPGAYLIEWLDNNGQRLFGRIIRN